MIQTSLTQIATVVAGRIVGDAADTIQINGAEFDSRRVKASQIFIALGGASTHGHEFVGAVKKSGCVAAIVEDEAVLVANGMPGVVVPNSLVAMQQLAAWWRREVNLPVLAITGSVGKTTTKEIAAAILSTTGKGTFSKASFNNHVGVPYTLLSISRDDNWAVIEIGMNHRGEIAPLSEMTAPDVAIVTTIVAAHIGNLGGLREIAEEKLDIAIGLKTVGGTLVLNRDSEFLNDPSLLQSVMQRELNLRYFGTSGRTDLRIIATHPSPIGIDISADLSESGWGEFDCHAPLFGSHHATNVAAAILGCVSLIPKLEKSKALKAIERFQVPDRRFVRVKSKSGGEIFDDSYNANPASMKAFFEATKPFCTGSKRWGVVLGEMRELGDFGAAYHRELAEYVLALKPAFVVLVGAEGALEYEGVMLRQDQIPWSRAPNSDAAAALVRQHPYDVLLIKGARGVQLEKVVEALKVS